MILGLKDYEHKPVFGSQQVMVSKPGKQVLHHCHNVLGAGLIDPAEEERERGDM